MVDKPDLSVMHRSELEAEIVHLAKLVERARRGIANVVREAEDEGDRVYFGSTNDADDLRALDEALENAVNTLDLSYMHGRDLYADLRKLRADKAEAATTIERYREALEPFAKALAGYWSHQKDDFALQIGPHKFDLRAGLTVGDFRRAAALSHAPEGQPGDGE